MAGGFKSSLSLGLPTSKDLFSTSELLGYSTETNEAILMEALRRGGAESDLARLQREYQRKRSARLSWRPASGFASLLEATLTVDPQLLDYASKIERDRCMEDYDAMIRAEFDSLGDLKVAFDFELQRYSEIRAALYRAGYDDVLETVFLKIESATFLKHEVGGGVHEKFKEKLGDVERLITQWGLADQVAKQIHSVGGFVPRYIASRQGQKKGAPKISNHAFGLAIDIDPKWNPHIKDADVIAALKEITAYDFGKPFGDKDVCIPPMDQAIQIHARMQDASDRLSTWLRRYLPGYEAFLTGKPNSSRKESQASDGGVLADLGLSSDQNACEEPSDTEAANQLLRRILRFHSLSDVKGWAAHGIQSIPLTLVIAMANTGFRWGTEYHDSKDIMHFELQAERMLERDPKPRLLEDLFDSTDLFDSADQASNGSHQKRKAKTPKPHQT